VGYGIWATPSRGSIGGKQSRRESDLIWTRLLHLANDLEEENGSEQKKSVNAYNDTDEKETYAYSPWYEIWRLMLPH
jgi:hypothetical protein